MSDQENRKTGIITAGFIIPGIQKFHSSNSGSGSNRFETQTVAWWETTTFASTTEKPKIAFKPSNNRGLETVTDAPTYESFNQLMTMATAGSALDPWVADTDEAKAAFCTVNPCMACLTNVQSKIVITSLPNGRTSSECVCPAAVKDHDNDGAATDLSTFTDDTELAQPIYAQVVLDYFT